MIAAPTRIDGVICSDRIAHPRNTAMTGLTYAYVETVESGAWWRSHVYALKARSEPKTTR
jgi:hypothetical protein